MPGIIPAFAGKRLSYRHPESQPQDHPRICGEKSRQFDHLDDGKGSSPHLRGKDDRQRINRLRDRIIPAFAGKSSRCSRSDRNQ